MRSVLVQFRCDHRGCEKKVSCSWNWRSTDTVFDTTEVSKQAFLAAAAVGWFATAQFQLCPEHNDRRDDVHAGG